MLLLNGCSYGYSWGTALSILSDKLNIKDCVNLSIPGSSNDRIFTSTMEYVLTYSVEFVVLSTTFWDRQSAPWNFDIENYNRNWISYSPLGIKNLKYKELNNQYLKYIEDRYKFDINRSYIDMFAHDVISLSGFLTSKNVRHVIYSAPGDLFLKNHLSEVKLKNIKENKNLLGLDHWSSNLFLYESGSRSIEKNVSPEFGHYRDLENLPLVEYLYSYIQQNNL
jgi:hypothetical protein